MRAAILSLCLWSAVSGADERPQFEVASIKPADRNAPPSSTVCPGRVNPPRWTCVNSSLQNYVLQAYNLRPYQIAAPDWVKDEKYTVTASIPAGTTQEQFRLMLQRLLEERFRMEVRREPREMPVYELVVGKDGHKMRPAEPPPAPGSNDPSARGRVDAGGYPIVPGGSGFQVAPSGKARAQFRTQTMEGFATLLTSEADRPVLDRTGLPDKYAFDLFWQSTRFGPADPEDAGPLIYKAVQDQLGLRLEAKRSPVPVLVIDRLEKTPIPD